MNPFTRAATTRPLFEEPTADIERVDAFSGPHGFLFGDRSGMGGSPDSLSLAQDYMEAAYALTDAILKGDCEDYRVAEPLMYLYRHSLELFLKGVMNLNDKHHDLAMLADEFADFVRREHRFELPEWVTRRIKEVAAIDPRSTAFRYGRTFDPKTKRDYPIPGESYVSLPHLQDVMTGLNWAIASVLGGGVLTEYIEALASSHSQRRYSREEESEFAAVVG